MLSFWPTVEAAWVTVTDWGETPGAVKVTVAILLTFEVLASYVAVIVEFPLPEGSTVHHDALLEAVQDVFEISENVVLPEDAGTFWFGGPTVSMGAAPACVTVTSWSGRPETMTVMVATRWETLVFSA